MAIADLTDYRGRIKDPYEVVPVSIGSVSTTPGRMYDLWTVTAPVGVAPTTAAVPTRTTAGALGQQDSTTGTLGIIGARFNAQNPGTYIICDRLSHQGGLNATVTGAQTTNLPTSALTRYTSGEGVMLGLTVYTQIGATLTTVTASYTNQAGTSGRTTASVGFGGTNIREVTRLVPLPLASGDTGVRAVANVNLVGTTGTAGAFGVTLFKPLFAVICDEVNGVTAGGLISGKTFGGIPEIVDGACLFAIAISTATQGAGVGALLTTEW